MTMNGICNHTVMESLDPSFAMAGDERNFLFKFLVSTSLHRNFLFFPPNGTKNAKPIRQMGR